MQEVIDATSSSSFPMARSWWRRPGRYGLAAVTLLGFVVPLVGCFLYIHHYAVNMIFDDQWTDINVIMHAHAGTLTSGTLWAQHNENRILFPNLVVLALAYTTHFNVVVEDYLNGILWCTTAGLLVAAHKRRSPQIRWIFYCPVAILLLSYLPVYDTLFGFNLSWFLVLFGLAGALFLLDRPGSSWPALAGSVAFAVLGSFSSLQGLLIWPAGLLLLYLRRRPLAPVLTWIVCALVTWAVYFYNFDFRATGGHESGSLAHPLAAAKFFFAVIGNVLGIQLSGAPGATNVGALLVGIVIVIGALWALVQGCRRGQSGGGAIGCALICFALLFMVSITLGRIQLGLDAAYRYSIFILMLWVGSYLALLGRYGPWTSEARSEWLARLDVWLRVSGAPHGDEPSTPVPWRTVTTWAATSILVVFFAFAVWTGARPAIDYAAAFHNEGLTIDDVAANIDKASDALIESQLGTYPASYIRPLATFASLDRLSFFDTALAADDRRAGLFPSLSVEILRPRDGDVLAGVQLLGASVPADGVTNMQFRVAGSDHHDELIGTAKYTRYGWLSIWDTTAVPNGAYQLRGVASRTDGSELSGPPVSVRVENADRNARGG